MYGELALKDEWMKKYGLRMRKVTVFTVWTAREQIKHIPCKGSPLADFPCGLCACWLCDFCDVCVSETFGAWTVIALRTMF
jgi:hypothetical protein